MEYKIKRVKVTYGTQILGMIREKGSKRWTVVNCSFDRSDCDMAKHFSSVYEGKGYKRA